MKSKLNLILYIGLFSIFLSLFQNCYPVGKSKDSQSYKSAVSGGEAYDGKPIDGTYIHEVASLGCRDITEFQRGLAEVSGEKLSVVRKSALDCNSSTIQSELKATEYYSNTPGYFVFEGQIFKHLDLIRDNWITETWCRSSDGQVNIFNEFSPSVGTAESTHYDKQQQSLVSTTRNLHDTDLEYVSSHWKLKIDLEKEIFLGAKKYSARLDYFDNNKEGLDLLCFAGSGVLPRTRFKAIKKSSWEYYDGKTHREDISPEKTKFYSLQIEDNALKFSILNLLSGKEIENLVRISDDQLISKVFWSGENSGKLIFVIYSPVERTGISTLTPVRVVGVDASTAEVLFDIKSEVIDYNNRLLMFLTDGKLFWFSSHSLQASATLSVFNIEDKKIQTKELDLISLADSNAIVGFKEFQIFHEIDVQPNKNGFVFKIMADASMIFERRSRLFYIDFKSLEPLALTPWGDLSSPTKSYWLGEQEVWMDFGRVYYDNLSRVVELNIIKYDLERHESHQVYALNNYELFDVRNYQGLDQLVLVLRPQFAYNQQQSRVMVFDRSRNRSVSSIEVPTKVIYNYHYSPYNNLISLTYWIPGAGLDYYMHIANLATGERITDSPHFFGDFSETFHPYFVNMDAIGKTLVIDRKRSSDGALLKSNIYELKDDKKNYLDLVKTGYVQVEPIKGTSRLLLLRFENDKGVLELWDLQTNVLVSLSERLPILENGRLDSVVALTQLDRILIKWAEPELGDSHFIVVSLEEL